MTAARCEIVIPVEQGESLRVQHATGTERIERAFEESLVPAVEQVTCDHNMLGGSRRDGIELAREEVEIACVSEVQIGQVKQHPEP
jgi:hypothetical protein